MAIVRIIKEMLDADTNKIAYCNFHINHPRSIYTPIMFLPFSQLSNVIICFDDIDDENELKRFIKVCAKRSRKADMELMFTCQYYTMIPRKLRKMIDFRIFPNYDKNTDVLTVRMIPKDKRGKYETKIYRDATKFIQKTKLYNTNEVVDDPTESDIINEIARISKNERDVEKNLMLYSGNRAIRKQLFKEILEKCDFNRVEREENEKKAKLQVEKKKADHRKQKNRLIRFLIRNIDLNCSKDALYGSLFFKRDTFKKKNLITEEEFNEIIMRSRAIFVKFNAQLEKKNEIVNENLGRRIDGNVLNELNKKYKIPYNAFKHLFGIPSTTAYNMVKDYKNE